MRLAQHHTTITSHPTTKRSKRKFRLDWGVNEDCNRKDVGVEEGGQTTFTNAMRYSTTSSLSGATTNHSTKQTNSVSQIIVPTETSDFHRQGTHERNHLPLHPARQADKQAGRQAGRLGQWLSSGSAMFVFSSPMAVLTFSVLGFWSQEAHNAGLSCSDSLFPFRLFFLLRASHP